LHQQVHTLLDDVLALPATDSPQDARTTLAARAEPVPWPMDGLPVKLPEG